jgi:hypothetical protein
MAVAISIKVAALLVALVSVLATHGARAQPSYNASSARRELYYSSTTGGSWQPAKATWYGRPNGAGPDNNGVCVVHVPMLSCSLCFCVLLACTHACRSWC